MILYCIIVDIVFLQFNFSTSQAFRKYFNNEIFVIYGMQYTLLIKLLRFVRGQTMHIPLS